MIGTSTRAEERDPSRWVSKKSLEYSSTAKPSNIPRKTFGRTLPSTRHLRCVHEELGASPRAVMVHQPEGPLAFAAMSPPAGSDGCAIYPGTLRPRSAAS